MPGQLMTNEALRRRNNRIGPVVLYPALWQPFEGFRTEIAASGLEHNVGDE